MVSHVYATGKFPLVPYLGRCAPSEWTMGLLSPADWSAKWIAHSASGFDGAQWIWFNEGNPAASAPPAIREFRRTITLPVDRALVAAKVRITADNAFTLRINGQNTAEARRCQDRLAVLRPLIHNAFFDPATGTYRANRQAFLTIALLARIMPDDLRPVILQQLVDNITVIRNGHLGTGLIGTSFMLDLLVREGRNDLVAMMMNKTTYPSWGFLSEVRGCTTWPETWTGWGSQIILVTGTPGAWFHEGLVGLRPDATGPGFKKFKVIPGVVKEADWARATHDSPYGIISVEWRKEANLAIDLDVTVPANTTAEIHVPASAVGEVTESGNPAVSAPGINFVRMENRHAVFAVGSGTYQFTGVLPVTLGPVVEVTAGSPLALDFSGSQKISALILGASSKPPALTMPPRIPIGSPALAACW